MGWKSKWEKYTKAQTLCYNMNGAAQTVGGRFLPLKGGQRQPIALRLRLTLLGRFRIRAVCQSATPTGLLLGRLSRGVAYGAVRFFIVGFLRDDLHRCVKSKIRIPRL